MTLKALFFDIDDTLYLERDYVHSGFLAIGKAIGVPEFGRKCWSMFLDGVRGNTFDLAKACFPEVTLSTRELVEIYRSHYPDIALCPDASAFIESFKGRTAVISDGPIHSQRSKFRALGLLPWIECPIFTQEIGSPKPSQAPFQLAAWTLNTPYEQCAYIADNPKKDFIGPKTLGMHTIRMSRPMSLHETVPSGDDVDIELNDFSQLWDYLAQL